MFVVDWRTFMEKKRRLELHGMMQARPRLSQVIRFPATSSRSVKFQILGRRRHQISSTQAAVVHCKISRLPAILGCVTHSLQGIDFVKVESGENSHGRRYDFRAVSDDCPFYLKSSVCTANRSKVERCAGRIRTLRLAGRRRQA
jgi:hypothetical protein